MSRLRIVAINDVYSLEHLPRLTSLVRHHAQHDPADLFLVVLAGDFVAPSMLSSIDHGQGMVDCLNHVPITHAILGNHEDDVDIAHLNARLRELSCTVLTTNVHGLGAFPKVQVLDVAGVRVGLIGVTGADPTLFRRPPFGGARIDPANETARRVADELLISGCAAVVPITHQRVADDRALAQSAPAFPLIIGGHEHDGLLETIGRTVLVKAPMDAVQAAVIELVWANGAFPEVRAVLEPVARYPEDTAMRARVESHMARVRDLSRATLLILKPGERLSSIGTRKRQTSMGALICSRLRDVFGAEGAIFNGGGIRGAREHEGRLTYGDLESEVPFDNEIVVARLPGAVLGDAIASSRANAPVESPGFLQVDDRMRVESGRILEIDGQPFDPARTYRIAMVRKLFEGLDHVEPLVRFARERPEAIPPPASGRDLKIALATAFSEILWEQCGGFDAIDEDRDGVVTREEIARAIERASGHPASELAAARLHDALDRNHDGKLTRADGIDE